MTSRIEETPRAKSGRALDTAPPCSPCGISPRYPLRTTIKLHWDSVSRVLTEVSLSRWLIKSLATWMNCLQSPPLLGGWVETEFPSSNHVVCLSGDQHPSWSHLGAYLVSSVSITRIPMLPWKSQGLCRNWGWRPDRYSPVYHRA